jgi:hypothetical protein
MKYATERKSDFTCWYDNGGKITICNFCANKTSTDIRNK